MKNLTIFLLVLTFSFPNLTGSPKQTGNSSKPNVIMAKKQNKKLIKHGDIRIDPYFWMKERGNPKVLEYLKSENKYALDVLAPVKKIQEKLFNEMKGRVVKKDTSVPVKQDNYYYYVKHEDKKEYPIYCRKKGNLKAKEEIYLDVNKLAGNHKYYQIGGMVRRFDHNMVAFAVDTVGRRFFDVYFKNLKTGQILNQKIESVTGSLKWANDNKTLFYVKQNKTDLRWSKVYRYDLDTKKSDLVYYEKDKNYSVHLTKSKTKKYIFIVSQSKTSTEYRLILADDPLKPLKVFQKRQKGHEYYVHHWADTQTNKENQASGFYVLTNFKAKNFRVMWVSGKKLSKNHWQPVIYHNKDIFIESIEAFKDYLSLTYRQDGLTRIEIFNRDTLPPTAYKKTKELGKSRKTRSHEISFKDPAYLAYTQSNYEYDTHKIRYSYESPNTPSSVYDYNLKTNKSVLKKQKKILGGFKSSNYKVERLWAKGKGNVKIPITLVYRKGLKQNSKNPLLLYGYGSYGYSMEPYFSSNTLSLLDRGFIWATAHIRGGAEMGKHWYEDGKKLKKKNTFIDFIACAKHLIDEKYTSPQHLYAMGGSAGGLLIGSVINMRPGLFNGVLALVPFVDVVTTMLDETIPLTTLEYEEWGNPNEKKFYDYMKSYSPYDNVVEQDYPHILVQTGFHDSQVQYWEPAKWVAKLRDKKTDDNFLLFYTDLEAGHSGPTGRFKYMNEMAFYYSFLIGIEQELL